MYRFLLWRLAPFYAIALLVEFLSFGILLIAEHESIDWSFMPMIKTIGVLLKTTTFSFLFLLIPYVIYLCLLPTNKVNTKSDKCVSSTLYAIFVFYTLFEESMSLVFWGKFSAALNTQAVKYLIDIREIASDLTQNYLFAAYIVALGLITRIIVFYSRPFLLCNRPAPNWAKRLFYFSIYMCFCGLIVINNNEDDLHINENYYNNELSKDGTYSLANSIWKSNIKYKAMDMLKKIRHKKY